ncbi:MAG: hypothetical protein P8Q91_10025, partial [Porticoccaceae bacterium]|nr:hypothetical protein [Porticoccaceae bacterium]
MGAAHAISPQIADHDYVGQDSPLGVITFATEVDEDIDDDDNLDINETDSTFTGWVDANGLPGTIDGDSNFDVGADKDSSGGWSLNDVDYDNSTGLCTEAVASNCTPRTLSQADIDTLTALVGTQNVTSSSGGILIGGNGPSQSEDLDGDNSFDRYAEDLDNDGHQDVFEDTNFNDLLDTGEDTDHDGVWSVGDVDVDNELGFGYNYTVDGTEADSSFIGTTAGLDTDEDVNNNGSYDYLEDIDSDGVADAHEDVDLDNHFDQGEDTNGNKLWDVGEIDRNGSACVNYSIGCDANGDPVLNYVVTAGDGLDGTAKGMEFTEDLNLNGIFDAGEDLDGDGHFDNNHEDQNNDGNWDRVEDQNSNGYWSVGDVDLNDSLGLGYNHTVTQVDIDGEIAALLSDAETNGVEGTDYLKSDQDGDSVWSVGDIDYGQVLSITRDSSSGVWDPLTQDDIDAINA